VFLSFPTARKGVFTLPVSVGFFGQAVGYRCSYRLLFCISATTRLCSATRVIKYAFGDFKKKKKDAAKGWVRWASCDDWEGGFCMVDGTLVPLFEKPGYHGEVYFDRKSNYSLNIQVR
jgi:hypothetical protein